MAGPDDDTREKIRGLEQEIRSLKRSLLVPKPETGCSPGESGVLVMQVSGRRVAVPVAEVQEVVPMVLVSPLPRAPGAIRGTITCRGRPVPVLDLADALTGAAAVLSPDQFLVLIGVSPDEFALVIDQVEDVCRLDPGELNSAALITGLPAFVHGVVSPAFQSLVLLDPAALLAAGELDLLRQLLAEATNREPLK